MKRAVKASLVTNGGPRSQSFPWCSSLPSLRRPRMEREGAQPRQKNRNRRRACLTAIRICRSVVAGHDIVPQTSSAVYAPPRRSGPPRPHRFRASISRGPLPRRRRSATKTTRRVLRPEHHWPDAPGRQRSSGRIVSNPQGCHHAGRGPTMAPHHPDRCRPHRDDVVPSYKGDAVGRWEGDTLVVDVTNFSDKNWLNHHGDVVVSLRRVAHGRNLSPPRQGPARNHHDGRGVEGAHRKVDGAKNHVDARAVRGTSWKRLVRTTRFQRSWMPRQNKTTAGNKVW